jgi:hypothetical protein
MHAHCLDVLGVALHLGTKGFHSSTSQLELNCFFSLNPGNPEMFPQQVLTTSRKVDECKALFEIGVESTWVKLLKL